MNTAVFILKFSEQEYELVEITDKNSALSVDILKEVLYYWKEKNREHLDGLYEGIQFLIDDNSIESISDFLKKGYQLQKLFGVKRLIEYIELKTITIDDKNWKTCEFALKYSYSKHTKFLEWHEKGNYYLGLSDDYYLKFSNSEYDRQLHRFISRERIEEYEKSIDSCKEYPIINYIRIYWFYEFLRFIASTDIIDHSYWNIYPQYYNKDTSVATISIKTTALYYSEYTSDLNMIKAYRAYLNATDENNIKYRIYRNRYGKYNIYQVINK